MPFQKLFRCLCRLKQIALAFPSVKKCKIKSFFLRLVISLPQKTVTKSCRTLYKLSISKRVASGYVLPSRFKFKLFFLSLLCLFESSFIETLLANPRITIVWSTENYDQGVSLPSYREEDSTFPLSSGNQANGDGDLVELGYYSLGVFDENNHSKAFQGDWIALTQNTRVGDSSSGYGFDDGKFAFSTRFTRDSASVMVFPAEPKVFVETLSFPITADEPSIGTPLCIRFYDSPIRTTTSKYNAVTGANWGWPAFPDGNSVPSNLYLKIHPGTAPSSSIWNYGAIFEDASNPYIASKTETFRVNSTVAEESVSMGTIVDINGSYSAGEFVDVNATAYENYEFIMWSGGTFTDPYSINTQLLVDNNLNIKAQFYPKLFLISVPPVQELEVQGHGPYPYGSTVNLFSPRSPTGYRFSHWLENDEVISISNPYSFTVTSDRHLSAVYLPQQYNISITSSDGGTIDRVLDQNGDLATEFFFDSNYSVLLSPNKHFKFSNWSSDSSSSSLLPKASEQPLVWSFSPEANATFHAEFDIIENYLFINAGVGAESVYPSSNMFLAIDENMPVQAFPKEGYKFSYWSDPFGILSELYSAETEANISKIDVPAEITANFELLEYQLNEDINITHSDGGHSVIQSGENGQFQHFGQYSINAVPHIGYKFSQWEGDGNLTNLTLDPNIANNELILDGPISLIASFVPADFTLDVSSEPDTGGWVEGGGGFSILDSLSVHAKPSPFWQFEKWAGDTDLIVSPDSPSTLVENWNEGSPPRDFSLTAHFSPIKINISANTEGSGYLSYSISNGDTLEQSEPSVSLIDTTTYAENILNIEGVPNVGWEFRKWNGLPQSDNVISYSLLDPFLEVASFSSPTDINLTASFARSEFDLSVNEATPGGETNGSGTYAFEQLAQLSAKPSPDYNFVKWSGPGSSLLNNSVFSPDNSLNMPATELSIYAEFTPIVYSLSLDSDENGAVSHQVFFEGNTHSGLEVNGTSKVVFTPHPNTGYQHSFWYWEKNDGSSGISYSESFTIISMDGNYSVRAEFREPPSNLDYDLETNIDGAGIVQEIKPLASLSQRTFEATSYPGYTFLGWETEQTSSILPHWTSHTIDINVTNGSKITGIFSKNNPTLKLDFNDSTGHVEILSDSSDGKFSLRATQQDNYLFKSWNLSNSFDYEVRRDYSSTVSNSSRIFIEDKESPELTLVRGFVYNFATDLSDQEELYFSELPDQNQSNAYLDGINDLQVASGSISFTVPQDCPDTLYYHSNKFPYSGNKIEVISLNETDLIPFAENPTLDIEIPAPLMIQANFSPRELNVDLAISGSGEIEILTEKVFYGEKASFQGTPSDHWEFSHWESNFEILEPSNPSLIIELFEDAQLTAVFEKKAYIVEVISSPDTFGNSFTIDNKSLFYHGDEVHISASPKLGKYFTHWSDPILENRKYDQNSSFVLEGDTVVKAFFESVEYNMTYQTFVLDQNENIVPDDFGGFISANHSYKDEENATFRFVLNDGYKFLHWKNGENNSTLSQEITFNKVISQNLNINAVIQKESHQVKLSTVPASFGKIIYNGVDYNGSHDFPTDHGQKIDLFASPAQGYAFEKWVSFSGNLPFPYNPSLSFEIKDDNHIAAYFIPLDDVNLKILIEPADSGWTTGEGTYSYNPKHAISAMPHKGWLFDGWIGNGITADHLKSTTINLNESKTIIAKFRNDPDYKDSDASSSGNNLRVLIVSPANSSMGKTEGSGIFNEIWTEIQALPFEGYDFSHWQGENIHNIFSPSTTTFMGQSKQIFAHFVPSSILADSSYLENGWWSNSWFGYYWKKTNQNWIYHNKLGWVFLRLLEDNSLWIWIEKLESWFWTTKTHFPYINLTSGNQSEWYWIHLDKSSTSQLLIYKFGENEGWYTY